jgi:hypothetical protein
MLQETRSLPRTPCSDDAGGALLYAQANKHIGQHMGQQARETNTGPSKGSAATQRHCWETVRSMCE